MPRGRGQSKSGRSGRSALRWFGYGVSGVVLLVVILLGAGYLWLRGSLPDYEGTVTVEGIDAPVEIVRDRHAIPHIFAESVNDAAFAMGYVHAQDRLWQMEFQRRAGAGRLSEMFGPRTLETDRFLRTLGLNRVAAANLERFSPEAQALYRAYAAGINAFLETRSGPLPPEFLLTGHDVEPWQPTDSIVWLKMMAWTLSANFTDELLRARLASRLSQEQIDDLWPAYPADGPTALAGMAADLLGSALLERLAEVVPPGPAPGLGSNNWVLAGAHTESGRPLLANDPHLGLSIPSVWYLAHIHTPQFEIIGATLPGVPLPVLGRTNDIAWGFTNTAPDVQDLFIERVDPEDETRYLTPDGSQPFEVREETIRVKRGADVPLTVRTTRHGPVISDLIATRDEFLEAGEVVAFAWTAFAEDDLTAQALARTPRVEDWDGFVDAMRDLHTPQQNIVFADRFGNIGMIAPARVPIRASGDGSAPAPGWTGAHDWTGFIPFAGLPRLFNPASGRIVTANNKIVGPSYPYFIARDWSPPYRAARIEALLDERPKHTVESVSTIQADFRSGGAAQLLPRLLSITTPSGEEARRAHALLSEWDFVMSPDRAEPLLYSAWARELMRGLFADELGPVFPDYWSLRVAAIERALFERPQWCDDVTTADVKEGCASVAARALDRALSLIAARHGPDWSDWRWGEAHAVIMRHRVLGQIPIVGQWFDIHLENGGEKDTVNAGGYVMSSDAEPFAQIHGPGYRAIYDMAEPERSVFIQATGQSGNPLSPHYRDFAELWRDGRYLPMLTDRAALADGALGTLTLTTP